MIERKPREIAARVLARHAGLSPGPPTPSEPNQARDPPLSGPVDEAPTAKPARGFLDALLEQELDRASLAPADRGLAQELTCGVARWQATLDWLIAQKIPARAPKPLVQILLRLGLYQMFWLDRIPDHAAVHETVKLTKQLGFSHQAGFVNAILRGYLRERELTERKLRQLKQDEPALGYSHPAWLCQRWQSRWNEREIRDLLDWNNTPPSLYARLNTLRTDAATLMAQWQKEQVRFEPRSWDWIPAGLIYELKAHPSLAELPSFQQGGFYIQDPSTLLSVLELDPQPGESILDACAAPGGKTTFIAQRMANRGYLMAQDLDLTRREIIRKNCQRLGVTCAHISRATTAIRYELSEPFDRVLVDAPCSNTGVLRRRVDLRWRIRSEEIARLQKVQLGLLRTAARQVKPGGTLVYSTCSLEPEENGEVVRRFLAEQTQFHLERERELVPFRDGVDGAYVARLNKGRNAVG